MNEFIKALKLRPPAKPILFSDWIAERQRLNNQSVIIIRFGIAITAVNTILAVAILLKGLI